MFKFGQFNHFEFKDMADSISAYKFIAKCDDCSTDTRVPDLMKTTHFEMDLYHFLMSPDPSVMSLSFPHQAIVKLFFKFDEHSSC